MLKVAQKVPLRADENGRRCALPFGAFFKHLGRGLHQPLSAWAGVHVELAFLAEMAKSDPLKPYIGGMPLFYISGLLEAGGQQRRVRHIREPVRGLGGLAPRVNVIILRNLGVPKRTFGEPVGARLS